MHRSSQQEGSNAFPKLYLLVGFTNELFRVHTFQISCKVTTYFRDNKEKGKEVCEKGVNNFLIKNKGSCLPTLPLLSSVGLPGFEPGKTEPKPVVLPLHHSPIIKCFLLKSGAKVVQSCEFSKKKRRKYLFRHGFHRLHRQNQCIRTEKVVFIRGIRA